MKGYRDATALLAAALLAGALGPLACSEPSPEQEDLASPARTEAAPVEREELQEPREERREERGEHTEAPFE